MSPINLFEYKWLKGSHGLPDDLINKRDELQSHLDQIWENRPLVENWYKNDIDENDDEESSKSRQQFIRLRKNEFSPRNYVGVIRFNGTEINLLPKIFYKEKYKWSNNTPSEDEIKNIHIHILYWLSYNKKIEFPKSLADLDKIDVDSFFEILILMFATYTREALNRVIYQNYYEVNEDNQFIKGRLDINGYIKNNITTGNWQRITCDYDSFDIDNRFNRIIKYVSKMLMVHSENDESKKMLYEISFLLDDVEDMPMTYDDCEKVHLNPFYKELNAVLDYCKLFLSNSMVYSSNNDMEVFAFLLPMEKIFEDFVGGFLQEKFSEFDVNLQKSNKYLAQEIQLETEQSQKDIFQLKPDIFIGKKNLIIDTKYKLLKDNDSKKGVSQSDMYQMVSYAIRYEVNQIVLLYPMTKDDEVPKEINNDTYKKLTEFIINDEFAEDIKISIKVYKLPIIHRDININYKYLKTDLDKQISNSLSVILNNQ